MRLQHIDIIARHGLRLGERELLSAAGVDNADDGDAGSGGWAAAGRRIKLIHIVAKYLRLSEIT